jgi:hypothetical protein
MDGILTISVFNSEAQRNFNLYVRQDRLLAFHNFLMRNRCPDTPSSVMPGISWGAVLGLDAIFERRPKRFPVSDILTFLAEDYKNNTLPSSLPPPTSAEIEKVLGLFAAEYPPDVSEGA